MLWNWSFDHASTDASSAWFSHYWREIIELSHILSWWFESRQRSLVWFSKCHKSSLFFLITIVASITYIYQWRKSCSWFCSFHCCRGASFEFVFLSRVIKEILSWFVLTFIGWVIVLKLWTPICSNFHEMWVDWVHILSLLLIKTLIALSKFEEVVLPFFILVAKFWYCNGWCSLRGNYRWVS